MIVISMVEDLTASQTKDYFTVIAKEPPCTLSLLYEEIFWKKKCLDIFWDVLRKQD